MEVHNEMAADAAVKRGPKSRLMTASHLDHRTRAAKRARKLAAELARGFGTGITEVQRRACGQAGMLAALADHLTVRRLWPENSQTRLLGGGTADAGKLLSVAEALTKFIPEPEHKNHRVDPRETMWQTYKAMRERGELFERAQEPTLRRRIA